MNPYFTALGGTVLSRWKARNFSLAAFPELACAALEECLPAEQVEVSSLIREFLLDDAQPFQTASGFGQPELVVYDDPRFYIQVLFWLEGTTDIHQHMFSGAFQVLAGSSIHSRFVFEQAEAVSAHLRVGNLRMTETHLLAAGCTVPIVSGRDYIHALFHLEMPSLTVVVRTHSDPGSGPQFTYLPPHLAVDPFHHDGLTMRRKQLLDVLERTEDPGYPALVREMIEGLDFERGFFILQNAMGGLRSLEAWDATWRAFQKKHGALAESVAPTLDEIVRRDGIAELRGSIAEPEHRFFLALLLNVPERARILEMIAQRFPGDPAATIVRWAEELACGRWLLDAEFPASVDAEEGRESEVFVAALRSFLEDDPGGASASSPTDLAALRAAFARSSLRALVAS